MERSIDEKIQTAIQILAEKVNKLFARKEHTHTKENIGIEFSQVAFSGNYGDLKNTPPRQDVGVARSDKAGIVMPGNGLIVGTGGVMSVLTEPNSGMYVSQNGVGINMGAGLVKMENDDRWHSTITIKGGSWGKMATELCTVATELKSKGSIEGIRVMIINSNSSIDSVMYITMTDTKATNCKDIKNYVKETLGKIESGKRDLLNIENCCTDFDEVCAYEFLKLMSDGGIYDAAVLYIFRNSISLDRGSMLKKLGTLATDTVTVAEYKKERFDVFGIEPPASGIKYFASTYIYTRDGYRNIYNVLSGIYGKIDRI